MDILKRHNVNVTGNGARPILFAHGYGCDQNMWRSVTPEFESSHKVVLVDLMGAGGSDTSDYSPLRYNSLHAYAADIVALAEALEFRDAVFVGHSVSAMIGVLASKKAPHLFSDLVLVAPSPCYINDRDYVGGFERADIDDLLKSLESNYMGWSSAMAPLIMGNSDRPELSEELKNSFCRMDPEIAKNFARVTFLSDNRRDISDVSARSLILQCANDIIAPVEVGEYLHANMPNSQLVMLKAEGHCPNLSSPGETTDAIKKFLQANS